MSQPLNGKLDNGQKEDGEGDSASEVSGTGSLLTTAKSCPLPSAQVKAATTAAAAETEEEKDKELALLERKKRVGKGKFKLSDLKPTGDANGPSSPGATPFSPLTGDSGSFSQAPTSSHSNGNERQLDSVPQSQAQAQSKPSFSLDRGGNLTVQEG